MTDKPEVVAWADPEKALVLADWVKDQLIAMGGDDGHIAETCDIALIRLSDYEALQAECEELRQALVEARDLVAEWGAYADEYYKEKHGLERDIARLDAVISGEE